MLTDRGRHVYSFAGWPMAAHWTEEALSEIMEKQQAGLIPASPVTLSIQGHDMQIASLPLEGDKLKSLRLFVFAENGTLDEGLLRQAVEVLQLSASIWDYEFVRNGPDALLRTILGNQPGEMRRIARQLCIDVESLCRMWAILDANPDRDEAKRKTLLDRAAAKLNGFLKGYHKVVLVDTFERTVISFMDQGRYSVDPAEVCNLFLEELAGVCADFVLVSFSQLRNTADVRDAYLLLEENFPATRCIFPRLRILGKHEFLFARKCGEIIEKGEGALMAYLSLLDPLREAEAGPELIETLSVYLLDSAGNIPLTAQSLFVHRNTVKYRIKKAQGLLGYSIEKMPQAIDLYTALALARLVA